MTLLNLSKEWMISSKNGHYCSKINFPQDFYSHLYEKEELEDPYWAENEKKIQKWNKEEWILTKTITLDSTLFNKPFIFFRAESIDTVIEVYINGTLAYRGDNMFFPLFFDAKPFLKQGENNLKIHFFSAETEALNREKKLNYKVPTSRYPGSSPSRNLVRKTQCHSGWDWGLSLMTSGIYGPIELIACENYIAELGFSTSKKEEIWSIHFDMIIFSSKEQTLPLKVKLGDQNFTIICNLQGGTNRKKGSIEVKDPKLWWPNGEGEPFLYSMEISLESQKIDRSVGFRTIELITEEDDHGKPLTFRVNGRDIFCKGANWIPCDAFPSRESSEKIRYLLNSAKEVHMNMIRVWGGGHYESDFFYETCNKLGLLVWQDFMFACSTYPGTPSFLKSVEQEVSYQTRRLMGHPSLAIWCGNNENLGALNWFEESRKNRDTYLVDYDRLNEGVIGRLVKEIDPQRQWWPSSPCAGENDYSDCWHDDSKGDMHYWSVWHEGKPLEAYYDVIPRFCSEFGFQSFPSFRGVKSYAPKDEWNINSPSMVHHQKNERGNEIITSTFFRYFRFPKNFENFLYLSQVQQALAIKMAVEYWRSHKPLCMGALYWQLNDNWPVASWSSIEYSGEWKLLHYAAKRFFAPQQVCAYVKENTLYACLLNDKPTNLVGELSLQLMDFSGENLKSYTKKIQHEGDQSHTYFKIPLCDLPFKPEKAFALISFKGEDNFPELQNFTFLAPPRLSTLKENPLDLGITKKDGVSHLRLRTEVPLFYTSLEASIPGHFSDSGFLLLPQKEKKITFTPKDSSNYPRDISFEINHLKKSYL